MVSPISLKYLISIFPLTAMGSKPVRSISVSDVPCITFNVFIRLQEVLPNVYVINSLRISCETEQTRKPFQISVNKKKFE
jgi:hypothetical protein